ncbi:MAG: hypothetical protein AAGA96_02580, partial [Verrucomicrobiota bacterium]
MRFFLPVFFILLLVGSLPVFAADERIGFPVDHSFLPKSWIAEPIAARIEPLEANHQNAAKRIISRALAKYPPGILDQFLEGVQIVGSLKFYNVGYGGTYMANGRQVVLVYRPTFDPRGFEQRFHHEFASILLKKNEDIFDGDRWRQSNSKTFSYRAG